MNVNQRRTGDTEPTGAVHATLGSGRSFWGPGDYYTFLVTGEESGGSMFGLDCVVGSGGGPPPHRHLAEDEFFYVFEGTLSFTAADESRPVSAGESVFVPRGTAHSYRNVGDGDVRMLAVYSPAGMEGWFREGVHAGRRGSGDAASRDGRADRADARGRTPLQGRVGRVVV